MHFHHASGCTLEWELDNFDPFTRAFNFHLPSMDDPPMAAWYNFNWTVML